MGNCAREECPKGFSCQVYTRNDRQMVAECMPACDPLKPQDCPTGSVCGRGAPADMIRHRLNRSLSVCYVACDKDRLTCPPGLRCASVSEDATVFGCMR